MDAPPPSARPPKLLDRLRAACRVRRYSPATADAYAGWVRRFVIFHGVRHPREMAAAEVNAFLTHLAVDGRVSASTQNQAFCALLFLYDRVLGLGLGRLDALRARRPEYLPVVLSRPEARQVLDLVGGGGGLYPVMAGLLYGSGLRVMECCRLRLRDPDLGRGQLLVRGGKGHKDRVVMLPKALRPALEEQIARRRRWP